jgi:hypothetical protein
MSETNWLWHPPELFLLEDVSLTNPDPRLDILMVTVHHWMLGRWGKHVPLCTPEMRIIVQVGCTSPRTFDNEVLKTGVKLTGKLYVRRAP